jgi:hypothetical protein
VGSRPLHALTASSCAFCLAVPWDIDLVPRWDRLLIEELRPQRGPVLLSSFVTLANKMEQKRAARLSPAPPPALVVGAAQRRLLVPDFRLWIGAAEQVAPLVLRWFPSFWFGVLAMNCTTGALRACVATDPVTREVTPSPVPLTPSDRATLVAACLTAPFGDPGVLGALLTREPHAHIRLHLPREGFQRVLRTL